MATRMHAREAVIGFLYAFDSGNENIKKFIDEILEERKIRNAQKEFAKGLFYGILESQELLDFIITKQLKEWDFDRIGAMERAILRLGVYEILYARTDKGIVINESIELSKNFGNEQTPRFINGVLDAIAKGELNLELLANMLQESKKHTTTTPKVKSHSKNSIPKKPKEKKYSPTQKKKNHSKSNHSFPQKNKDANNKNPHKKTYSTKKSLESED